jgi:hypothetical protein
MLEGPPETHERNAEVSIRLVEKLSSSSYSMAPWGIENSSVKPGCRSCQFNFSEATSL